jgi:ketosteroid isomerase-like protein
MFELRTNGLVRDYLSAWSRHSADDLAALYADDALYEDLRLSATLRGSTAIRTHLCQVFAACPDAALAVAAEPLATGSEAYIEWLIVRTGDGETQEIRGVSVMLIEGDLIVRQIDYPHVVARAAGSGTASVERAGAVAEDNIAWGE